MTGATPEARPAHLGGEPRDTNRLAGETSPYLLQHAHNPVDWYPWGPEALARAKETDRPIFLSIGYAACHWCHVMERESFEDEATAADLNRDFVAIKVDREERPDLDALYMDAVQAVTGQGGWPMSVFLTPDGRPFYGGTYFPPDPRHGLPSFRQLLARVARIWREDRENVEASATRLAEHIRAGQAGPAQLLTALGEAGVGGARGAGGARDAGNEVSHLLAATAALEGSFDPRNGGWGGAPKFPQPMALEFLVREHLRTADARPLSMARRTLDAMAAGGIYDHLGGGFARYATDAVWLVPHFEKMLYDNAQLARVYLHAWQATGEQRYREVATETLDFMAREMRVPAEGAFASSLDADTEGEEGATYTWDLHAVRAVLGSEAALFEAAYDVTEGGNWEGRTILRRVVGDDVLARSFERPVEAIREALGAARRRLLEARDRRPQPGRDDKVLTAWDGLAVAAFAEAGRVLGDERYTRIAGEAAGFILERSRLPDGRLARSWKDDQAKHAAVLEDHTHLADGLMALYEATFDERWYVAARELIEEVLGRFADPEGGFHDTAVDSEALIARPRGLQDNALPSGSSMAALVLLRFAALTGEERYRQAAEGALAPMGPLAARHPSAFANWLLGLQLAATGIDEIAIVGDPDAPDAQALLRTVFEELRPGTVVAFSPEPSRSAIPLLHDRDRLDGRATAYVCRRFACQRPVSDPELLAEQLAQAA